MRKKLATSWATPIAINAAADIGEILGISVNTVKSRLQRSLAILREKFHRWAGDGQR